MILTTPALKELLCYQAWWQIPPRLIVWEFPQTCYSSAASINFWILPIMLAGSGCRPSISSVSS